MFIHRAITTTICCVVLGAMACAPAFAKGGRGGGGHGGGGHGGGGHGGGHFGGRVGVFIGAPLYYAPYYGYGYPYYSNPYYANPYYGDAYYGYPNVVAATPPAAAAPVANGFWYYCQDTRAYYPYVSQCASPWQPVAAQPPAPQN